MSTKVHKFMRFLRRRKKIVNVDRVRYLNFVRLWLVDALVALKARKDRFYKIQGRRAMWMSQCGHDGVDILKSLENNPQTDRSSEEKTKLPGIGAGGDHHQRGALAAKRRASKIKDAETTLVMTDFDKKFKKRMPSRQLSKQITALPQVPSVNSVWGANCVPDKNQISTKGARRSSLGSIIDNNQGLSRSSSVLW